jgi:hypothetical protein
MTVYVVIPAHAGIQCLSHSTNQLFDSPFLGPRLCFQLNRLNEPNEPNEPNGLITHHRFSTPDSGLAFCYSSRFRGIRPRTYPESRLHSEAPAIHSESPSFVCPQEYTGVKVYRGRGIGVV